jgi:hypothetical protein
MEWLNVRELYDIFCCNEQESRFGEAYCDGAPRASKQFASSLSANMTS